MELNMSGCWPDLKDLKLNSESIMWIPCIPNYATGALMPLYNLVNCPLSVASPERPPKISRGGIKSMPWTQEEDHKLQELVETHGLRQWSKICKILNCMHNNMDRKGKHCRERWYNHLNPEINKGEWSYEEDILIIQQQKIVGNKWSMISRLLTGRTENAVKNRWNCLIKNTKQDINMQHVNNAIVGEIIINELSKCISKKETI